MHFSSIWLLDRSLSGATTPSQSGPGSDGNKGVLRIPQSSSITGTSLSDCLVSYLEHLLSVVYPSAEVQSVYFTAPAIKTICYRSSQSCTLATTQQGLPWVVSGEPVV